MDSNEHKNIGCRANDLLAEDALVLLRDIHAKVASLEAMMGDITEAFVLNDLHKPDYDGHRKSHLNQIKVEEIMNGYKQSVAKRIVTVVVTFLLGLIASGLVTQLSGYFK